MSDVVAKLKLADTAQIVVLDADGQQVPYQVTYDEKVIFPATVKANGTATYTIQPGAPEAFNVIACGKYYPERLDDLAWENDLVGFRAYGPALQARNERGFGYDLFTKYNTTEPILEALYAEELNPEKRAKIAELKKTDPKAAAELQRAISYHVDHGYGMDCYAVGPTLGCGTSALMEGDTIVYPYCYRTQEILDNGSWRFRCGGNACNFAGCRLVFEQSGDFVHQSERNNACGYGIGFARTGWSNDGGRCEWLYHLCRSYNRP